MSSNSDQIWAKNPKSFGIFPDQTRFLEKIGVVGTRTNWEFSWGAMYVILRRDFVDKNPLFRQ